MKREDILKAGKPKTEPVIIPQLENGNGPVVLTIRQLSAAQIASMVDKVRDGSDVTASMLQIVASVVDEVTGDPIFTEADIPEIEQMSAGVIAHLNTAINKLNSFTNNVQEVEKNS